MSSASRPSVHGSGSDSGLSSWSTSAAAGAADVTSAGLPARNKSGYVDNDNEITSNYITYKKINSPTLFISFRTKCLDVMYIHERPWLTAFPNKRVENTTCGGVLLVNFVLFGNVVKHCLVCMIYLLNRN